MNILNQIKNKFKSEVKQTTVQKLEKKQLSLVIGGGSGDLLVPTTTNKAITKPGIG